MSKLRTIRRAIQRKIADSKIYEFAIDKEKKIIHSAKNGKNRNTLCSIKHYLKNFKKMFIFVTSNESSEVIEKLDKDSYKLCPVCTILLKDSHKVDSSAIPAVSG